ncbi:hypothetical protein HNP32_001368 [Brevundimonas bullata]|uniref:Lipoprotein n=1 Tax=Brevundimonas bullata TaxID=13160 RepID=A0A7W7N3R5_9CAUL|nr:hypothetical protein [Brevundimonas bullata]MBB4797644.1 hypothetical protein [Brevundimonas bullata]MBB6382604.1 hypothetical protein [Brevundimonas bullata]
MIRNAVLSSVALLALAACDAPESAKAPDAAAPAVMGDAASANVLTPLGYGPLKIGMTQAEADAAVGPPPANAAEAEPSECRYYHPPHAPEGLLVMVEKGVLTRLTATRDSTVKTEDGVGVGADGEQLKARYGAATVTPHKYQGAPSAYVTLWPGRPQLQGAYVTDPTARGLMFEIGDDGKVAFIHGGGPSIQNVEGCS